MLGIIIGIIVLLIITYIICIYNLLVKCKNNIDDAWADIDTCLKKRFDLIPNLMESVKAYAKHENAILKGIIESRNKYVVASNNKDKIRANNELSDFISKIFVLAENYPNLKANKSFLSLQKKLSDIENEISKSRETYNEKVLLLNNKVEMFPSNIISKVFKFEKEVFFEESLNRKNKEVKF